APVTSWRKVTLVGGRGVRAKAPSRGVRAAMVGRVMTIRVSRASTSSRVRRRTAFFLSLTATRRFREPNNRKKDVHFMNTHLGSREKSADMGVPCLGLAAAFRTAQPFAWKNTKTLQGVW